MKRLVIGFLAVLFMTTTAGAVTQEQQQLQPQEQVEVMISSVLEVLQQEELTVDEKKQQVSGRIQQYLNMASMSRRTLGNYWNEATPEQRQRFSDLFVQVLEGTYLNRINDYSGGSVQYLKQRIKGDKAIVDTRFVSEDLEIPVKYKMIFEDESWQLFDVVIEGVSLIRNYRSSYGEIIRKTGYSGLFELMEIKVAAMMPEQVEQLEQPIGLEVAPTVQ